MSQLRCMVVTPEKTELDVNSSSITVPLFDGELGILVGHSPLVGRLGFGMLKIKTDGGVDEYFVEGGFVQVAGNEVSVLTDKVSRRADVSEQLASTAMKEALDMPKAQPEQSAARDKAVARARAMSRAAK
ncbi:MAG: F0F1 ATP synthase subunit epsilon [Aureliella sp.]